MTLKQLLSTLLQHLPCAQFLDVPDVALIKPDDLMSPPIPDTIGDAVYEACRQAGMSERGATGFGEFVARMCSGWSTRYSNEVDVLQLNAEFGRAAFGNPYKVIRLYLLPSFDALSDYIDQIRVGLAAAYRAAEMM